MINMTIVKMNESKSSKGIAFQPVSEITGTSETLLVLFSKGLIFLFLKLLASSHLPLWLFVSLSLARGLKSDDVKIALNLACKQALPLKMARGRNIRAWLPSPYISTARHFQRKSLLAGYAQLFCRSISRAPVFVRVMQLSKPCDTVM